MSEPIKTIQISHTGRPTISDEQYSIWLNELEPFLKNGHSLRTAIEKCGLNKHRTTIYEKLRLNDWFSDKINYFRSLIGELTQESFAYLLDAIHKKTMNCQQLNKEEVKLLIFIATHHKSASPFFLTGHNNRSKGTSDFHNKPSSAPQIKYILPDQA